jgi:uncharacterized LabA/DUF88 family protein
MPDSSTRRVPSDPHLRRWMMFVDGENLTIRAQEWARDKNIQLQEGLYYKRDVLVWMPGVEAKTRPLHHDGLEELQYLGQRSYYYTSATGNDEKLRSIRETLWYLEFQPEVFKKAKGYNRKTKAVDIALATGLLGNAYRDNYDAAVLVAGDGDYVPLVEEAKRLGKVVHVTFFGEKEYGLSPDLRLASDRFWDLEEVFAEAWERYDSTV